MSTESKRQKTLYVRFPRIIKDKNEVREILCGDYKIKLNRQPSHHCHVKFLTISDKLKTVDYLKNVLIDNKPVFFATPPKKRPISEMKAKKLLLKAELKRLKALKKNERIGKKLIKSEPTKLSKILYVSNIPRYSKIHHVKAAMGECKTIAFLKPEYNDSKTKVAIVKLNDVDLARKYLKNEVPAPVLLGHQLIIKPDIRERVKKTETKMKIYGEDGKELEIKEEIKKEEVDE